MTQAFYSIGLMLLCYFAMTTTDKSTMNPSSKKISKFVFTAIIAITAVYNIGYITGSAYGNWVH